MRKRNGTRKFIKLRKGTKNYSTRRNKSGGSVGTFVRSFSPDGRLLEEFKTKIRNVELFGTLLDDPDNTMREKLHALEIHANNPDVNKSKAFDDLNKFIDINYTNLRRILENDTSIKRTEFYNKVIKEVHDTMRYSQGKGNSDIPDDAPPPGMGDESDDVSHGRDNIVKTTFDGREASKITNLRCPNGVVDQCFTCDYVIPGTQIPPAARCKLCYKSKREHIQEGQGGGSRRRRRNTRSRKNKTRRNGKCRACRCPGGCKRSTCPCYRGRSKPCCTKRCKSRGRRCKC